MERNTVDDRLASAESLLRVAQARAADAKERAREADREVAEAWGRVCRLQKEREHVADRDPLAEIRLPGYGRCLPTTVAKAVACGMISDRAYLDRPTQLLWERVSRLVEDDELEVVVGRELQGDSPDDRILLCADDPDFHDADGPHVLVVRPRSTGSGS